MIESGLVYIHYADNPTAFAGCGALVEGPFIVTCRHVWEQTLAAPGNTGTVHVCFPPPRGEGSPEFRIAKPVDNCDSLGNPPDLVILSADVPAGSGALVLARAKAPQHGPGYAIAGLRRNGPGTPVRDVIIPGSIGARIDGSGLRQFTGAEDKGYFTDLGSSGSPLLIETTDELAGIVSLSETGLTPGAAPIREAFAVPSATIHRHLSHYVGRESARAHGVDEAKIPQILDTIGAAEITIAELRRRLELYFQNLQTLTPPPPPQTNHGADIDSAIEKSRRLSAAFQPADAMAVLDDIIAEDTYAWRQRLVPLLEEKARQQRLVFDYEGAKETLRKLLAADPDQTWRWIDLGDISVTTGKLNDAIAAFREALASAERLTKTDPTNTQWQRDLSVAREKIGDVQLAQGDAPAALSGYQASLEIRQRLAKTDPTNTEWQRNLSVSHNKIGDVQRAQGGAPAALISYQADLDIAERLAKTDPTNTQWQRDLSISYEKIGDMQAAQGDAPAALISYQTSLDIRERLAKTDPTNTQWQRDLAVSHNRIGDMQAAQGDTPAALARDQASLAIAERLAKTDPTNTEWQRDLSVSHEKIGDVQAAQGDAPAALSSYQASLDIRQRLAKTDPTNTLWQRDLAVSFGKVALIEAQQDLREKALAGFRQARDIITQLRQKSPDNATLPKDLAWYETQIAALEQPPDP